jgi:hypothetical protein
MASWLARDARTGVTWLIQRGGRADPVIAVDKEGCVLRSFGKGMYKVPHAIPRNRQHESQRNRRCKRTISAAVAKSRLKPCHTKFNELLFLRLEGIVSLETESR